MKKTLLFLVLLSFILLSCKQEAIFFYLYNEPPLKDPRIPGAPTNIVRVTYGGYDRLYVGASMNSRMYYYSDGAWSRPAISLPPGTSLGATAVAKNKLYALVYPGKNPLGSTMIYRYDPGSGWEKITIPDEITARYSIQTLYGAGDSIFAGAQLKSNYMSYAIMYHDAAAANPDLAILQEGTAILKGAAEDAVSGEIFLAAGKIIYKIDPIDPPGSAPVPVTLSYELRSNAAFTGIIYTGGAIIAVTNDGNGRGSIHDIQGLTPWPNPYRETGVIFTGALGIWKQCEVDPAVIVTPGVVTVQEGATVQFSATDEKILATSVSWFISGGSGLSTIASNGLVTLDPGEVPGTELEITAISHRDPSLSGTAKLIVATPGDLFGTVSITGCTWPGETLRANTSKILGGTGIFTYQWMRDGTPIGTDSETYTLVDLDSDEEISVTVSCGGISSVTSAGLKIFPADPWKTKLLLLGIKGQESSLTHGYRELVLDDFGVPTNESLRTPGEYELSSVSDRNRYDASIGIHPVESIMQVPPTIENKPTAEPPIFASTAKNGLWSYRKKQWNAEE